MTRKQGWQKASEMHDKLIAQIERERQQQPPKPKEGRVGQKGK